MGFMDKAKAAAEQATAKAREGVEDIQTKRELTQAYGELGEKAYELADRGEITHAELAPIVEKIRGLKAKEAESGAAAATSGNGPAAAPAPTETATAAPPPSDAPPAMPS
jgi:hypothetical protein